MIDGVNSPTGRLFIFFAKVFNLNIGVALGRCQRSMSQQLLNRAEIGAFGQQMRGKRMSERVRRYRIGQSELRPDFSSRR